MFEEDRQRESNIFSQYSRNRIGDKNKEREEGKEEQVFQSVNDRDHENDTIKVEESQTPASYSRRNRNGDYSPVVINRVSQISMS